MEQTTETNTWRANVFSPAEKSPIDIVIPFHGQYESVVECLAGILNYTPSWPYNVFFVDDCSANDKFLPNLLSGRKKAFGVRLEKQLGFGAAVNEGVDMGYNPFVCVMHSDVFVNNIRWLPGMIHALEAGSSHGIGMVSARFENPGTASSCPEDLLKITDMKDKFIESSKPLPLTCCLFERSVWKKVGPLKPFPYAWYEDVEYFYRMKKLGFKQGISPSVVNHAGGRTIKNLFSTNPIAHKTMKENAIKCREIIKAKNA